METETPEWVNHVVGTELSSFQLPRTTVRVSFVWPFDVAVLTLAMSDICFKIFNLL